MCLCCERDGDLGQKDPCPQGALMGRHTQDRPSLHSMEGHLEQRRQTFSVKGQTVNISVLADKEATCSAVGEEKQPQTIHSGMSCDSVLGPCKVGCMVDLAWGP